MTMEAKPFQTTSWEIIHSLPWEHHKNVSSSNLWIDYRCNQLNLKPVGGKNPTWCAIVWKKCQCHTKWWNDWISCKEACPWTHAYAWFQASMIIKFPLLTLMMGEFINFLPITLMGLFWLIYFCNVMFIDCAKNTNNTSAKTLFVNVNTPYVD
jgi:hypothetical protein